jgi:hypothetical protein
MLNQTNIGENANKFYIVQVSRKEHTMRRRRRRGDSCEYEGKLAMGGYLLSYAFLPTRHHLTRCFKKTRAPASSPGHGGVVWVSTDSPKSRTTAQTRLKYVRGGAPPPEAGGECG